MERYKSCTCGLTAQMVAPLFPMFRDVTLPNGQVAKGVKFYTAIYECKKCKSLSLRGESNLRQWSTFIEWITAEKAQQLIEERKSHEVDIRPDERVPQD
jgi:hypothetical protein